MSFTDGLWAEIAPIRDAISAHPLITGLEDGSLAPDIFDGYLAQDAVYLGRYARVLAGLASQASDPAEVVFWSTGARQAIEVERDLHAAHVEHLDTTEMSPTTLAYTSFLLSLLAAGSYPVAAAGVLPCYWVYADVGAGLNSRAGELDRHPYGDWIVVYSDPTFAAEAEQARAIVDLLARDADATTLAAMRGAFMTASRYEWMFWDAAWRREKWPV